MRSHLGYFQSTDQKPSGSIVGKVTRIEVGAVGLLGGTGTDLPDYSLIQVTPPGQEAEDCYLCLQRVDLETHLSMLTLCLEAYRGGHLVGVGYYLDTLAPGDTALVKWVDYVTLFGPQDSLPLDPAVLEDLLQHYKHGRQHIARGGVS